MQVKVIKACWYNETFYDPETSVSDIIIEYAGERLPTWAESFEEVKAKKTAKPAGEGENNKSLKVNELPLVEKNALLEEAKAIGIEGNQILSWKVDTLIAKIAAKKPAGEGENEGEEE